MASEQAQLVAVAVTRKSAMHLDLLRGQDIALTIDDLGYLYEAIGRAFVSDALIPTIAEVLGSYGT